jgi:hypothetical protein
VYGPEKALPYVVPTPNVRIECPLALVDRVLDARPAAAREAAHAFGKFLFMQEAQVGKGCDGRCIWALRCNGDGISLLGSLQVTAHLA